MIAADAPRHASARLLALGTDGGVRHMQRADLAALLKPGDLVVANDAATLPASLGGTHMPSGAPVEVRLAGRLSRDDATLFTAIMFGAGDHRTPTEDRPLPPPLAAGDRLSLGPLAATIESVLRERRLVELRFLGDNNHVIAGIARHGRPIQYAYVPEPLALWDVWTAVAAHPFAFEPPSAGFAIDWAMLAEMRRRGIGFATLTHAAGISSTGDAALDRLLPFDEPFRIPAATATAIARTRARGGRVIAIGTTVVRALESAAIPGGRVRSGHGIATGRIGPETRLRIVDAILSGVHAPGESHHDLLRAFVEAPALERMAAAAEAGGYRNHEFGDFVLIEREGATAVRMPAPARRHAMA